MLDLMSLCSSPSRRRSPSTILRHMKVSKRCFTCATMTRSGPVCNVGLSRTGFSAEVFTLQVARRVKVLQPDTPVLNVRRMKGTAAHDKVASGMEVAYSVTYTPQDTDHFYYDLVVCTEREKFLVPCTVTGSKAALDFPDHLDFPMTPAKCSSSQTCLVTNVGSIAADVTLTAYPPFHAEPARAQLPPGDTMQCSIQYTPQSTGITPQQQATLTREEKTTLLGGTLVVISSAPFTMLAS